MSPLYRAEAHLELRTPGHADVSRVSVDMLRYIKGSMLVHSWDDSERDRLWAKGYRGQDLGCAVAVFFASA